MSESRHVAAPRPARSLGSIRLAANSLLVSIAIASLALGGAPAKHDDPASASEKCGRPRVVMVTDEDEYRSEETLPRFAEMLRKDYGCRCTVIHGRGQDGIPGLEALKTADVVVLFVRRRACPRSSLR